MPLIVFCCVAAGVLDVWQVASGSGKQLIYSAPEQRFGEAITPVTQPHSRILTLPDFTHPVYWSGRRVWLGYIGWLWSHGLDTDERRKALFEIYGGLPQSEALLRKYEIDYVVVTPRERSGISQHPDNRDKIPFNEDFFRQHYPVAAQEGEYVLYKIR